MGNGMSEEERRDREKRAMDEFASHISEGPDLRVNKTIKMFTSLDSSDHLRQHYEKRKEEAGSRAEDCIKSLMEKLGDLTPAPELAGLGALAIAVLIDMDSSGPPEESTKEALRRVFAEEKASEVWDHIDNTEELGADIRRIEVQLSAAITKLKNSMVRDGHVTPEALKAWVNGAAFHIQMLIHLVRLGGTQSCDPVERLLSAYLSDLDLLFKKHREMIRGKCEIDREYNSSYSEMDPWDFYLVDEDSVLHLLSPSGLTFEQYFEAYYNRRYITQKLETQTYFSDVRRNLQQLVDQTGSFNVN
ncbi:uncharacterized protein [Pagrus major]|uniref:uncharacterized protein n=1 Tax=Pagrus major TaxID=143350 RepID=UPI003CC85527